MEEAVKYSRSPGLSELDAVLGHKAVARFKIAHRNLPVRCLSAGVVQASLQETPEGCTLGVGTEPNRLRTQEEHVSCGKICPAKLLVHWSSWYRRPFVSMLGVEPETAHSTD